MLYAYTYLYNLKKETFDYVIKKIVSRTNLL